jgi:hypothetical protein
LARRRRLSKIQLGFFAGIITIIVIGMAVGFPSIANFIVGTNDSTEYKFAFPNIDNSVITNLFPAEIIGGQQVGSIDAVVCFFKFTLLAKQANGGIIEIRESQFSGGGLGETIFTTFSIATVPQTTSGGELVLGSRIIDRYEITPKIRCDRDTTTGATPEFETATVVLPSNIKLVSAVVQPDGSVKNLADRSLTVQSTGLGDEFVVGVGACLFCLPPTLGSQGVLRDNVETEFKGLLGATKAENEFFKVSASEINNLAKPQLETYTTEVRFAIQGNLNMNYLSLPSDRTQIFPIYSTDVAKTVRILVDRIQDVPASEFPQEVTLTRAVTGTGKCLAGLCGSTKTLNPEAGVSERTVTVDTVLDNFQGVNVEGAPILTLRKVVGGSNVGGISNNPTFMQFVSGDTFRATMVLPSSIADATYIFQVTSQTRSEIGTGTFAVSTPPPDAVQPPTCDAGMVLDDNDICVPEPTGDGGDTGGDVESFCPDGTSAVNGCTIRPVIGGQCLQGQIEELDGSCTNPLCPIGTEYIQSIQRCNPIDCGSGKEFDTTLLQCVTSSVTCEGSQVLNADKTGCISITEAQEQASTAGGATPNVLSIGQEIRWQLVTESETGQRTPVLSGTIPKDTSLFAGLTQTLQFTVLPEGSTIAQKFGVIDVDSFLKIPSTVISPQISIPTGGLNQQLHFYHNNIVKANGQLTNNEQALVVNTPSGTLSGTISTLTGNNFFHLGKFTMDTSDILSTVTGATGAFNCFEEGETCTTVGGVELKNGDTISVIYTVDGTFDLSTEGGTKEFDGVINQMSWHGNFFYSDIVLQGGEACTALSGRELFQCNFDETGNNNLEGVCPSDENKTVKQNFDECLASLSNSEIDVIQSAVCTDVSLLAPLIDVLNVESGFSEEFGGTGAKTTEDIIKDLQLASGCVQIEGEEPTSGTPFMCPSGTKNKTGVTVPETVDDCVADNACDELEDGTKVIGGTLITNGDGTQICTAPPVVTNGGAPMCQTGSMRNEQTGQCEFPPKEDEEGDNIINGLIEALNKLLGGFSNTDDKSLTTGSTGGNNNEGGACSGFLGALQCALAIQGEDDEEPPSLIDIIPIPPLTAGGSPIETVALAVGIIIVIIVASAIIARRRRKSLLG